VFRFHGGEKISADVSLGILLGELVVHGYDIARALHRPWPIDPRHVQLIQQGINPILPGWLDPQRARGHTGRYEVRLRGQGVHRFDFDRGRLTVNPPGRFRPDVVISADPMTFLLVMYKRTSQWPGIGTGRLVAWGRRPWLALGLCGRFHQP
jgi:SCP-2 sterol transfer family